MENYREGKITPEAEVLFRRWVAHLNDEFTRHESVDRRAEIVRDELFQIYLGRPHGGKLNTTLTSELPGNVLAESFDPRNATLEAEHLGEVDAEKYAVRKPLIWFWQMFDRSPLGLNHWLGFRFRCVLGHHIFAKMGKGVKIFPGVEFALGYNLTIEDNCRVSRGAYLDDRAPLVLRAGTEVGAYARVEGQGGGG